MKYSGWVPIRRGIVEHLTEGKLTANEYFALIQLILFCDAATGGGTINAPLLMWRCGYAFSLDAAQRALNGLHEKRYIWYRATRRTKRPGPYWIHNFELTLGPYKSRYTNLAELFDKSTICDQDVWNSAAQTTVQLMVQPTVQTTVQTTDKNNKEQETHDKRDCTTSNSEMNASANASWNHSKNAPQTSSEAQLITGERRPTDMSASSDRVTSPRHMTASPAASRISYAPDSANGATWGDHITGLRFVTGSDPHYVVTETGRRIGWEEARAIEERGGTKNEFN